MCPPHWPPAFRLLLISPWRCLRKNAGRPRPPGGRGCWPRAIPGWAKLWTPSPRPSPPQVRHWAYLLLPHQWTRPTGTALPSHLTTPSHHRHCSAADAPSAPAAEAPAPAPAPAGSDASELRQGWPSTASLSAASDTSAATGAGAAGPSTATGPRKGTAAGLPKWSGYAHERRQRKLGRPKRALTFAERLNAAVATTVTLRLLLAVAQGLLLFAAWRLAEAPAPSAWTLSRQQRALQKAWTASRRRGLPRADWAPLAAQAWGAARGRAAAALKQPRWAAAAAAAQHRPALALAAANVAVVAAAFLSLWATGGDGGVPPPPKPQLAMRLLSAAAPGLRDRVALASAWQRAAASLVDSVMALIAALGCCQLAAQLQKAEAA